MLLLKGTIIEMDFYSDGTILKINGKSYEDNLNGMDVACHREKVQGTSTMLLYDSSIGMGGNQYKLLIDTEVNY